MGRSLYGQLAFLIYIFFFLVFFFFLSFNPFYPLPCILSTFACICSFVNFGSELIEKEKNNSFFNLP